MVDEQEATRKSKSPAVQARMHRYSSDRTPNYKKPHWNRPKDIASTDRQQGGCPNRSGVGGKPMVGQGGSQKVAGSGNHGAQPSSKPIICYYCGKPGHTRKDSHEAKTKLSMIHSDSEAEEYSEMLHVGTIMANLVGA